MRSLSRMRSLSSVAMGVSRSPGMSPLSCRAWYRPQHTLRNEAKFPRSCPASMDSPCKRVMSWTRFIPSRAAISSRIAQKKFSSRTLVTIFSILSERVVLAHNAGSASMKSLHIQ